MEHSSEPLAYSLDFDSEIFGGVSMSEIIIVSKISAIISFSFSLIVCLAASIIFSMYSLLFVSLPITPIVALFVISFGIKKLASIKDGKPEGYHMQIIQLKFDKMLSLFGRKPILVSRVGFWGTVRYINE